MEAIRPIIFSVKLFF